jgi:cyclase
VLFTGDVVFKGATPFVLMGSVAWMPEALKVVASFEAATLVPGHGEVCGREVINQVADYMRFVQRLAEEGHQAGLSPLEAAREADLGAFADLSDSERIVGNLHRAYAELEGAAPGAPIDLMAAFSDMIEFNGGRPMRCLA